jgi:hypothetical protein
MKAPLGEITESTSRYHSDTGSQLKTTTPFIITVLGFSFWFFMAVPFASHRESYWWLGMVHSHSITKAFSFISKTYRPLAQATTWLGFLFLDPNVFPTSVARQTMLQSLVYGLFVLAWWQLYCAATQRRVFALVAFVAGGVFFSGYVQLFHIYGVFYVPVILILGVMLRFYASGTFQKREGWLGVVAMLLAFWHPFATALFVGFYFGFYLETFRLRNKSQHLRAITTLAAGTVIIAVLVVALPTRADVLPFGARLIGFLISYQTNEINLIASLAAFLLSQLVVFSTGLSVKLNVAVFLVISALSVVSMLKGLPLLLVWLFAVLMKLIWLRRWSLFVLTLTALLLPFGAGIGTPIYALFAIAVGVYVTSLGWSNAEELLSFIDPRCIIAMIIVVSTVVVAVRKGIDVPIFTQAAGPLFTERERTYQLERILVWLHSSDYCGDELTFAENAGSPIDSIQNIITRRNRPPADLADVRLFWNAVLRCRQAEQTGSKAGTAIVTFGGSSIADSSSIFTVEGMYAGEATVWRRNSREQ